MVTKHQKVWQRPLREYLTGVILLAVCLVAAFFLFANYIYHNVHFFESETVAATCHSQGYTVHTCTLCGETKTEVMDVILPMRGDVDGDGAVTNGDVICLFQYMYDATQYPLVVPEMADVDGDGRITNGDVICLFQYMYDAEANPLYFPMNTEEKNELPVDSVVDVFA